MATIMDSYSESNQDSYLNISGTSRSAQTFTANGEKVVSAKFYLQNTTGATGNIIARLYAMSGNFGTTGIPTGSALATSDNFNVSTITSSFALKTFTFSGANQYVTTNGVNYCISIETSGSLNTLRLGRDMTSPTAAGNMATGASTWAPITGQDFIFYVYGEPNAVSPGATLLMLLAK